MMDKFVERLVESAAIAYMPRLEEMVKASRAELEEVKGKVRTDPDLVETWFDREIGKLNSVDVKEMIKNATAGI